MAEGTLKKTLVREGERFVHSDLINILDLTDEGCELLGKVFRLRVDEKIEEIGVNYLFNSGGFATERRLGISYVNVRMKREISSRAEFEKLLEEHDLPREYSDENEGYLMIRIPEAYFQVLFGPVTTDLQ